jgi:hypothetical protein
VLLVGDASFDPKNYLGLGDFDLVPTKFVPTAYLKTSSDDWLVDPDGDTLPNMAIGRLPARTAVDVSLMVSKIIKRESALGQGGTPPEWSKSALLISDEDFEFDFEAATAALRPLLPPDFTVHEVAVDNLGPAAPAEIVSRINDGQLLVNYVGHGSVETWSRQGIFSDVEAGGLANGERLPVFVLMTCLNGMFDDLSSESLAEALLLAPDGGGGSCGEPEVAAREVAQERDRRRGDEQRDRPPRPSAPQREQLQDDLRRLAQADGRLSVTEWVYLRVVARRLDRLGTAGRPARPRAFTVDQVAVECRELLGLLARVGVADEAAAQAALDAGVAALGLTGTWRLPAASELKVDRLDQVLAVLEATPFALRARVLAACEACAAADGRLTVGEVEVLRAVADTLAVARPPPLPPLA